MKQLIDLHIHTTFSDGTDGIVELLEKIKNASIKVFSVTDHDTMLGCMEIEKIDIPKEIKYIRGIEFSCRSSVGKCHILGYNYDCSNTSMLQAVECGKRLRREKLDKRLAYLHDVYNVEFLKKDIEWLYSLGSAGKPHIAQLMVSYGIADNIDEAIKRYINGCKGGNDRIQSAMAINAINEAGGIPVWAHPLGGEGEKRSTKEQFEAQLEVLLQEGIKGLECYYSRYAKEEVEFLVAKAKEHGLVISGGSDYHGANKTVQMGQLSSCALEINNEMLTVLDSIGKVW